MLTKLEKELIETVKYQEKQIKYLECENKRLEDGKIEELLSDDCHKYDLVKPPKNGNWYCNGDHTITFTS